MAKVIAWFALAAAFIIALVSIGDKPELLVDASPACAAEPLENPCAEVDCDRPNTQEIV